MTGAREISDRDRGPAPHNHLPAQSQREEVDRLYEQARALEPKTRTAFVESSCRETPQLRDEVLSLLEQADAAEEFFHSLRDTLPSSVPGYGSPCVSIGQTVGHYEIRGRIGAGGMGTVYRAHDTRLDREVALKFLPPYLTVHSEAQERLLVEARAAAALEHPNVCTIHEIGESEDGRPFIAMSLYDGETLQERLSRGPLPPGEAVVIATQIARGLKAAHARGIVHRDVKPGNVMLTADGTVKLLDFGLAKVADATLTRPGATGTVAYMSPEQARGDPLDQRADLWSLGVVLYEMLAGMRPFRGGNDQALIQAILHEEPEPVSTGRPGVPLWLARIVERLLQKERDDRIASADELLVLLDRARAGSRLAIAPLDRWIPESTLRRVAMGVVGVLAGVALFFGIRTVRDVESPIPAADAAGAAPAIAVLPFTVHGQGLEVWREGMVDLLSMGLDGAGGLRAIDSRTLLARWNEEMGDEAGADLELSLGVARRTRASYALVGSAVAAGPQVRFAADIYDLENGRSLGQAVAQGPPDSIFALVDQLGMRVLEVVFQGDRDDLPTIDLAGVTTSSLPALKAYLDGEVHFRRTELLAAIEAWERAVRADTLFALAYYGLSEAYAWDEGGNFGPGKGREMLDRAHRLADRLPALEAALVRTKSSRWNNERGSVAAVEAVTRQYPDVAEAWYNLGEAYHHGPQAMRGPEETERAFRRAAELQPASSLYRAHLVDLAFLWQPDSARVGREVEAYGRLAPRAARTQAGRIAFGLAFGAPGTRAKARADLDTLNPESASQVYMLLRHPRLAPKLEAVFPAIERRLDDENRDVIRLFRFHDLGARDGKVRQALTILDEPGTPDIVRHCGPLHLSVRGLPVPERVLEERLAVTHADSSDLESPFWVACAAGHAAARGRWGEHAGLIAHAEEIGRRELAAGDSTLARWWQRAAREAEAHGLWRQGRKEEALRAFEDVLGNDARGWRALWYVGRLALELGRLDQAELAFRALWEWDGPPAQLYLGRIYERTGRTAEALEAYEFVLYAWRNADPELQPLVQEARRAVARLSGAEG